MRMRKNVIGFRRPFESAGHRLVVVLHMTVLSRSLAVETAALNSSWSTNELLWCPWNNRQLITVILRVSRLNMTTIGMLS